MRLVGTDMSELAIGRHLCDAFHLVPAGSDPEFADAMLERRRARGRRRVLPQSSFDLLGPRRGEGAASTVAVLVSSPEAIRRSNDKAETYALLHRIGVPAPAFRRVAGARAGRGGRARARLPRPAVCFKPVFSSGSRGFRVLDPTSTARTSC